MKFSIPSQVLTQRLFIAGRNISAKNQMAILNCFLFEIEGKTLSLSASDRDSYLTTKIDLIDSDKDFRFAVNAKSMQEAFKEIPDQPIEIEVNEETFEIVGRYQNGVFNLMGQSAESYPEFEDRTATNSTLLLEVSTLESVISMLLFAAADDTLRPIMNGIYFDIQEKDVTFVSSNAKLLMACIKINLDETAKPGTFILPKKSAAMVKTMLSKEEGNVQINYNQQKAVIATSDYLLQCRLVEGRYPNYKSVVPQDNPMEVRINREALMAALRRVMVFSDQSSALVKLQFLTNKLTISTQDIDFSKSAEEVLMCEYDSAPIVIGFKGSEFLSLLNSLSSNEVEIFLADGSRAALIVPAEPVEGQEVKMIMMPLLITDY